MSRAMRPRMKNVAFARHSASSSRIELVLTSISRFSALAETYFSGTWYESWEASMKPSISKLSRCWTRAVASAAWTLTGADTCDRIFCSSSLYSLRPGNRILAMMPRFLEPDDVRLRRAPHSSCQARTSVVALKNVVDALFHEPSAALGPESRSRGMSHIKHAKVRHIASEL